MLSLGSGPDFYTTFGLAVLIFGHDFATSSRPRRHQLPPCNLKVAGSNAVPGRRITKSARSIDRIKLHVGLYYRPRLLRAKKVGNPRLFSPLMDDLSRTALHMPYAFGRRLDRRFGTNGNCGLDISGHIAGVEIGECFFVIIITLHARRNDGLSRFWSLNRCNTRVPYRILRAEGQWGKREGKECSHDRQDPPDRQHSMITI